jgi:hypothetical protein
VQVPYILRFWRVSAGTLYMLFYFEHQHTKASELG